MITIYIALWCAAETLCQIISARDGIITMRWNEIDVNEIKNGIKNECEQKNLNQKDYETWNEIWNTWNTK